MSKEARFTCQHTYTRFPRKKQPCGSAEEVDGLPLLSPIPISSYSFLFEIFIYFAFLGVLPWQMEVPRPGVESELQLPAYTTITATRDLSHF